MRKCYLPFLHPETTRSLKKPYALRCWHSSVVFIAALIVLGVPPGTASLCFATPDETPQTESDLAEMDVEELIALKVHSVYGASKFEQKTTEAPSSVTIITREQIKKYGYRKLSEILRSVRGFYATYDRNYDYLGVRGFGRPADYNTRMLLLVDGHRINDNIYDSAAIGEEFVLDLDLIEQIEVIRGPSSSLYGANAFFGVINVITRQAEDFDGVEVSSEVASHDTYRGRLSYGKQFGDDVELTFSVSGYDSEGQTLFFEEFDDPETNNGIAHKADGGDYYSWFADLSYENLTFQAAHNTRKKNVPTASFETVFNDSRNQTEDERRYFNLKYEDDIAENLNVMARAYYDWFRYKGNYIYDYREEDDDPPFLVVNKDFTRGERWGAEVQVIKTLFEQHKLSVGSEYFNDFHQEQANFDTEPFFSYLSDRRNSDTVGVYLQDEFKIVDYLTINAGVRYDYYEEFGDDINPRVGIIISPLEDTTLKLLYGTAFRRPNSFELYYDTAGLDFSAPGLELSNPDLVPEEIETYEVILEQNIGENLRGTVTGFYYEIEDLIEQVAFEPVEGIESFRYENTDLVTALGIEAELEAMWDNGLQGRLSYSYQETEDEETDRILTNSPRHLGKFNFIAPLLQEYLFLALEVQYTGRRLTLVGQTADDFWLTNVTLFSENLVKGLEISAGVYNLFDETYGDPGSSEHEQDIIEQDGRIYRLELAYNFDPSLW